MANKTLHLICNAHIDPVWLWAWEEGVAETISTFRTAVDLCEEFDTFIFNHNEAILYKWVEEYEPSLFIRIQKLVKAGKWHIMGGWFLQPDCNMTSGEGLVRQILAGRTYFMDKFGSRPKTAINFDPFGHARGLVQILRKSGFDSYIHCRPTKLECQQEFNEYVWIGYDGSEIIGTRPLLWYNSALGEAGKKLKEQLMHIPEHNTAVMLWGVGNHGGGPSRKDIRDINKIISQEKTKKVVHSTPENYFADLKKYQHDLVRWEGDFNPFAVGCYTSMIRIKQAYRAIENEFFAVEKIVSSAAAQDLLTYPFKELKTAEEDMLKAAFHDILPGSAIQPVEEYSLGMISHGREILSQLRTRAFFIMAMGQKRAESETFPVFVYNHHPWPVKTTVMVEFNKADIEFNPDTYSTPILIHKNEKIAVQAERPYCNFSVDWRKRIVFKATLEPGKMNRFDIKLNKHAKKPSIRVLEENGKIRIKNEILDWAISSKTGLIDFFRIAGRDLLKKGSFQPLVMKDTPDPWGMTVNSFNDIHGKFTVLSEKKSAEIAGAGVVALAPVRVIEDGSVRTIIEAFFGFNDSFLIQTWRVPKSGSEIELEVRVFWNEKDKMLKLSVPTVFTDSKYMGDLVYSRDKLPGNDLEVVAQKWTAIVSEKDNLALTCINDSTYGSSFKDGEMRLSLLRSPAYAAHPIEDWPIVSKEVFRPRMDQGERILNFWINGGASSERMDNISAEAQICNEKPMALWFSPSGLGKKPKTFVKLSNNRVLLTALKRAENSNRWIIRLFEPTGKLQKSILTIDGKSKLSKTIRLKPFEIKTLCVDLEKGLIEETNLMEESE